MHNKNKVLCDIKNAITVHSKQVYSLSSAAVRLRPLLVTLTPTSSWSTNPSGIWCVIICSRITLCKQQVKLNLWQSICVNKNCKILNKNFYQMLRLQGVVIQKMQGWGISNLQLWLKWTTYHSKQIEALQQLHDMSSCIADVIWSITPLAISFCLHISYCSL